MLVTNVDQYGFETFPDQEFIRKHFARVYASFDLGFCKPDPRIFEAIRGDYSAKFRDMLLIGDDPKNDGGAARDLGMDFMLVH